MLNLPYYIAFPLAIAVFVFVVGVFTWGPIRLCERLRLEERLVNLTQPLFKGGIKIEKWIKDRIHRRKTKDLTTL